MTVRASDFARARNLLPKSGSAENRERQNRPPLGRSGTFAAALKWVRLMAGFGCLDHVIFSTNVVCAPNAVNVFFTEPALTFPWTRIPQPRAVAAGVGRVVAVPQLGGLHQSVRGLGRLNDILIG